MKVIRASAEGQQLSAFTSSATDASLSVLSPCSENEVCQLILQSPTKSCALDPIPAFLVKELVKLSEGAGRRTTAVRNKDDQRFIA